TRPRPKVALRMPPPESAKPQGPDGSLPTPAFSLRARTCSSSSRRASLLASAPKTRGSSPGCMAAPSAGHGVALARRQGGSHGVVEARGQDIEAGLARVDLVVPEALGRVLAHASLRAHTTAPRIRCNEPARRDRPVRNRVRAA